MSPCKSSQQQQKKKKRKKNQKQGEDYVEFIKKVSLHHRERLKRKIKN